MGFIQEFREFAVKGNAVDMAVGIILGTAFNKIVNSVVNDLIMPPIGLAIGGVEFKDLQVVLRGARVGPAGEEIAAVAIRWGMFVNTCIEFLIVAFSVFLVVKVMNRVLRFRGVGAVKT
jgi:large conductance mechanosensitive channel